MTVEALIDNFKVLDLLDCPSVSPSFTLNALSRELPGMLEHRQTDRLKKLLNIFSKVQTSWLFPDATCFDFLMILRQLFHPIVSIDHKVHIKVERKEKPSSDAANGSKTSLHKRRVIQVHLSFDLFNDVFSLILSLISRVLRFEEDRIKESEGDDKENRVKRADRKEETNYSLKWGFGSPIALSTRIVRELSLNVITAISTYSDPNPWTNEALNAAAKELEEVFLCLNQNASLTEFIVGIPGEGDDLNDDGKVWDESSVGEEDAGGGEGEINKERGSRKRKPSSLGLEALDLSDNRSTLGDAEEDADATLCGETTIVVSPSETKTTTRTTWTTMTTKRTPDSNGNTLDSVRTTWPLYRKSHLKSFLRHLAPFLVKDTLPTNPVKKYSFLWLVANVEAPRLSGAEVLLFPQPLIFLDSHEKEDKVIGLKSLTEIVQKIPPAAILDQNMYLVISKSLIHQMMLNSVKIVHVLHPCIIAFLETYHLATKDRKTKLLPELIHSIDEVGGRSGPSAEDLVNANTPRNQFFRQLLLQFELGGDPNFRRESLKYFGAHIRGMGIALCRYLKKTISFLSDGLCIFTGDDVSDPEETMRLLCLDAICDVIRATKPRMQSHSPKIVSAIIKVMLDVTRPQNKKKDFARDNVMEKCKGVLILLGDAAPKEVSTSLKMVPITIIEEKVSKVIRAVLATLPDD